MLFCYRTGAVINGDTNLRLELLANLLYLYEDSWRLDTGRVVVGHNVYNMQTEPKIPNKAGVRSLR